MTYRSGLDLDIQVIKHGNSVDVRIERNGTPRYVTWDQKDVPAIVAALIDAGFAPEWEAKNV